MKLASHSQAVVAVSMTLALVLASCAGAASPTPSASGTSTPSPTSSPSASPTPLVMKPLKIATNANANFTNLALFYVVDKGLLAERGYDAELIRVENDATGLQGLLAGEYAVLSQGVGAALAAAAQGGDVVLVSSVAPHVDYQFVATGGITRIEDLAGKTVGVSRPGAISEQVPKLILQKHGVDLNSVTFVAIGGDADRARALAAGQIDAAVVNTVNTVEALKAASGLRVLVDAGSELSEDFLLTGVVTSRKAIADDHEAIQAVVTALIEASRILQSERDAAVEFGISAGMPADSTAEAYETLTAPDAPFFGVDGGLSESAFNSTVQSLLGSGSIPSAVSWGDVVDLSFIAAALQELGSY